MNLFNPPVFESIAQLLTALPVGGQYPYVDVIGFSGSGTKGGGRLFWKPTSTLYCDNGVRFKPSGLAPTSPGCWEREVDDVVHFDWFGPVGDGVTDNSSKHANYLLHAHVGRSLQDGDGVFCTSGDANYRNFRIYFNSDAVACATGNINLSNPGTAIFDGVAVTSGQFVMCPFQTSLPQNGLYQFNGPSSALTRATTATAQGDFLFGNSWHVRGGTTYNNHVFVSITLGSTIVVGTTPILMTDLGESNPNRGQGDTDRVRWLGNGLTTTRKRIDNVLSVVQPGATFVCDWKNNPLRKMKVEHGQMRHDGNAQNNPIPAPVSGVSGTVAINDIVTYSDGTTTGTATIYSVTLSGGAGTLGLIPNSPYVTFTTSQTFSTSSGGSGTFSSTVSGIVFQQARSERALGRGAGLLSYEMIRPCVDINRVGDGITFAVTTNSTEFLGTVNVDQIGLDSPYTQRSNHTFSNPAQYTTVDGEAVYSQLEVNNQWATPLQTNPPIVQIASTFRCVGKGFTWNFKHAGINNVLPKMFIASGAYFDVTTWNTLECDTVIGNCTIRTASQWEQVYSNNTLNGTRFVLRADYSGKTIGLFESDSDDNSRGLTTNNVIIDAESGFTASQLSNVLYEHNALPVGTVWQHNNLTINLPHTRVMSAAAGLHRFKNLYSSYDGLSQGSINVGTITTANFAAGSNISTPASASVYKVLSVSTTLPITSRTGTYLDGETIVDDTSPGPTAVLSNPGGAGTGQLTLSTISGTLVGGHVYRGLTSGATSTARSGAAISSMLVTFVSGVVLANGNSIIDSITGATAILTDSPNFASALLQGGVSTIGQTNELRVEGETIFTNSSVNLITPITNSVSDPWNYYIERGDVPLTQGLQIKSATGLGTIIVLKKAPLTGSDTFTGAGTIAAGAVSSTRTITIYGITTSWGVTAKIPSVSLGGLQINAWIDSANTLKYFYSNPTAGGIAAPDSTNVFELVINP